MHCYAPLNLYGKLQERTSFKFRACWRAILQPVYIFAPRHPVCAISVLTRAVRLTSVIITFQLLLEFDRRQRQRFYNAVACLRLSCTEITLTNLLVSNKHFGVVFVKLRTAAIETNV
jgi:hypothetical protein